MMPMRVALLFLIQLLYLVACSAPSDASKPEIVMLPPEFDTEDVRPTMEAIEARLDPEQITLSAIGEEQLRRLEAGFSDWQASTDPDLSSFFDGWAAALPPTSAGALRGAPDLVRTCSALSEAFYSESLFETLGRDQMDRLAPDVPGLSNTEPCADDGRQYWVVRDWLYVVVVRDIEDYLASHGEEEGVIEMGSVLALRPAIRLGCREPRYLSPEYEGLLHSFLDTAPSEDRQEFLGQYIDVMPGHWAGWHVESHPAIQYVVIQEDQQRAVVDYRIRYSSRGAIFDRQGRNWVMTGTANYETTE